MSDRIRVEQSLQVKGEFIVTGLATVQNNLSLNNTRITNLADPVDPNDAATRVYVDNLASGLDFHEPVKLATTTDLDNIGNGTWVQAGAGPGATLTAGNPGTSVIDGVVLLNGDRILVKNQVDTSQNGIYIVSGAGSTFETTLTRVLDQNEPDEFPGSFVFVNNGTVNASTGWVILTPPDTVDVDPVVWIQFSGAAQLTGGDGITITGTVVAVNLVPDTGLNISPGGRLQISSSFAGTGLTRTAGVLNVNANQSQITQIGTITSGTWNATPITLAFGGTGGTTASTARTNLGITSLATQQPNNVTITGGTISNVLFSPPIAITSGGTGANNAADARDNLVVVHRGGDTMTGDLTIGDGTGVPKLGIDGAIATDRSLSYFSNGVLRWEIVTNNEPEDIPGPASFTKVANPDVLPVGTAWGADFSPDGIHLAVSHSFSPFVTIYERSGNTFTKLANPATLPTDMGQGLSFSPDGAFLAVSHLTIPRITIYQRSGNTFTKLANPATLPAGDGTDAAFSPDGVHLAVAHDVSPFITIYERSGTTFTKLADPAALPTSTAWGVEFSPDGTHMAVAHTNNPFVTIYERSGNTFTKLADPATLPTGNGWDVGFSADGVHMAVAHSSSPRVTIYERSGNTFTKLADPATLPTSTGNGVSFSSDGAWLSVAHNTSPFVTIYQRSGNTFTKIADPATLPTGNGLHPAFSADVSHLAVAHATSPFVTIYEAPSLALSNEGSNFAIRRYDDAGILLSESIRINRITGKVTFGDGLELTGALVLGTPLAVTEGGTGANNATDARTNLGLGTISTQDANNVAITGGSITGITDLAIADGGTGASTAADARNNLVVVHRAGDTMTGDLTVGDGTGAFAINIDGADASLRLFQYQTAGLLRWSTVVTDEPETGSDAGSNYVLRRFSDAQVLLGEPIRINRATGNIIFENNVDIQGATTLTSPLGVASGGTGADNATDARTNLGLGSIAVQDASNVSITGGSIIGINDLAIADGGTGASNATDARLNLGLGSLAVQDATNVSISGGTITGITPLTVTDGGTGANNAADARDNLGISANWIGTLFTAAPNDIVNTLQWAVTGGTANVSIALTPKGSGALQAQVADDVATGGDIRGSSAVDWQTSRALATQVASGSGAVISGGLSNTASGSNSTVAGGQVNTASNTGATVSGGQVNTASGINATVSGSEGAMANKRGQWAYGATPFSLDGDAQVSILTLRGLTTDATPTEIFLQGTSPDRAVLPENTTWAAKVEVVARSAGGVDNAMFERKALIKRASLASSTEFVGPIQVMGSDIGSEVGSPPTGWDVILIADTTNGALVVQVTGEAATNIRWMCKIELVEVGFV